MNVCGPGSNLRPVLFEEKCYSQVKGIVGDLLSRGDGLMKRLTLVGIALLLAAESSIAHVSPASRASNILPGARARGAGGLVATLPDPLEGIWWNPALLSVANGLTVDFVNNKLGSFGLDDLSLRGGSVVAPLPGNGRDWTIGLGYRRFGYGESQIISETGEELGTFEPYDLYVNAGVSLCIGDAHSFGAGVGVLTTKLSAPVRELLITDTKDEVMGGQLGYLWSPKLAKRSETVGTTIQPVVSFALIQLGPGLQFEGQSQSEDAPSTLHLGMGLRILSMMDSSPQDPLSNQIEAFIGYEVERSIPESESVNHFGVEVVVSRIFGFRGGWEDRPDVGGSTSWGLHMGTGPLFPFEVQYQFARAESFFFGEQVSHHQVRLHLNNRARK